MAKSFGDPLTRQRLSTYYAMMPQFEATVTAPTDYRERVRREMKFAIQQRLRERCNDIIRTYADGFQLFTLPEHCSLELPTSQVTPAAERLKAAGGAGTPPAAAAAARAALARADARRRP